MRRLLPIVLVLLVCAGCARRSPSPIDEPTPGVTPAPGGLEFTVKVTPRRFALGQHVALEATLFNESQDTFDRTFPTGCVWDFEVATEIGRVLTPQRMCTMAFTELHLEPGELRMIMREWAGHDDYFNCPDLAPGRYLVSAGLVEEGRVVPMSEPVWIEVLPRGSK